MTFLRLHWFDLGGFIAVAAGIWLSLIWVDVGWYERLCWLSLIALCGHQLEEYRVVGTFPGMLNGTVFGSDRPDRFPLNTNTALIINVGIGWTFYLGAVAAGQHAIWLGIATMCVNFGNAIAHLIVFNIKGRTLYNPGMATGTLFFLPLVVFFAIVVVRSDLTTATDWIIGIALGIALNVFGLVKLLLWLADRNTPWAFPQRCLLPADRDAQP